MSIADVIQRLRQNADALEAAVSGRSSDAACQEALRAYQMAHYSGLASLAWYLGCNAETFQREAVPAAEIVDDAFFEINREREFDLPSYTPQRSHGTYNSMQQFGSVVEGASL